MSRYEYDDDGYPVATVDGSPEPSTLEPIEIDHLKELEAIIEAGFQTFAQVGTALLEIRDQRLYRSTHGTFEAYLKDRWDISRSYAHRTMEAAQVTAMLPMGNKPASERVARELVPLKDDPEALTEAWQKVTSEHPAPTAKQVREAIRTVDEGQGARASEDGYWQTSEGRSRWQTLHEGIRALDPFIGHEDDDAASVPPRRRATTAKRLREAASALVRIARELESVGDER